MKIKTKPKGFYPLLVLSLVFLFNPNINMIDILPDFVGYFILSSLFFHASDCAAHFEEARVAFKRLAWLNLAKIPALAVIVFIRSGNTVDNDVYAMMSLSFAAVECILSFSAIKNIFEALMHLGQRTDAAALITPYKISSTRLFTPEALRTLTYIFVGAKCVLYSAPDLFLLTNTTISGGINGRFSSLKYYPFAILFTIVFGFIIGGIWLSRTLKYVRAIRNEGRFSSALRSIATEDYEYKFETRKKLRSISSLLSATCVAILFSIDFTVDNFEGFDILPDFIYGIILTIVIYKLFAHVARSTVAVVLGFVYSAVSSLSLVFSVSFFERYDYRDLAEGNEFARASYLQYIIFSVLEFILVTVFLIFVARVMNGFIYKNTGILPGTKKYVNMESDYHASLVKKSYLFMAFGILNALVKLIDIIINSNVQAIFTDPTDVTQPVIMASPIPWFGLVGFVVSAIYLGYALYFTSIIKEEAEMKYLNNL